MDHSQRFFITMVTAVALALAGCGGSGTGDGPAAGGGISGTGMAARGVVVAKGSLTVNDTRFNTDNAVFQGDDNPSFDDIQVGMVVEIAGSLDDNGSAVAATVRTEEALKGPVGPAPTGDSFVVLGQTVILDIDTVVDDNSGTLTTDFTGLAEGDLVEVHGDVGDEVVVARFVQRKTAITQYKVKGTVDAVAGDTLTINALTANFSTADLSDLPAGGPAVGQFVEVKFVTGSGTVATKVELDGIRLDAGFLGELQVEGSVTATMMAGAEFASGDSFSIGSQSVRTGSPTVFVGGVPSDLVVGSRVEAEGQFDSGDFLAHKVKFKDNIRLESDVGSSNGTTVSLSRLGGIAVTADLFTEFNGDPSVSSLADLTTGHHLRIRGRRVGTTGAAVIARRIDVDAADDDGDRIDVTLQGPVAAFADPTLRILGVTVDTTGFDDPADFQDEGDDGTPIGRAAFFGRLAVGALVKAQGREDAGAFRWREVQLEE